MQFFEKSKNRKVFNFVIVAFAVMAIGLSWVSFRVNITKLNYRIAKEIRVRNELLEDSRRLKVEMATLKSPHRIEKIAKEKLKMDYPLRGQVVYLK